jgi:hypothetical protein
MVGDVVQMVSTVEALENGSMVGDVGRADGEYCRSIGKWEYGG